MAEQKSRKFVVGVTGGIGSGKSAACSRFEQLGIVCVDADIVARQVVEPNSPALSQIQQHFGDDIILFDGTLNRARLRAIIFEYPDEKVWLESLLHPLIKTETQAQIDRANSRYVIYTSPLLFETQQHNIVDRVLVIDVPEEVQLERTQSRDNISLALARSILANQASRAQRLSIADDVIINDQGLDYLYHQVDDLHQRYLKLSE
ncbi:dephospho-CoA kinase [Sessilibacter sp. MAH1]